MQKSKIGALRGFTLLELIVVIAIIGILSVIILPSFSNALAKARDGRKVSELKGLQSGMLLYSQQNGGKYPATGYATGTTSTCKGTGCLIADKVENKLPVDATNGVYSYIGVGCSATTGAVCDSYQLAVQLEALNTAHQGDSDATVIADFNGVTAGGSDGTINARANIETCILHSSTLLATAGTADCVYDLIP
jgi:prepilin-type N-terminal cleavage/methylation domain-containing protein